MKLKKSLALLALVVPFTASATPIIWDLYATDDLTFNAGPVGEFTFDGDTNLYSAVDILGSFDDIYSALAGNASEAKGLGDTFGDTLYLTFDVPLTDVNFPSFVFGRFIEECDDLSCEDTSAGETFSMKVRESASVPEPSTIALLSLGLAAVGFARRKQS